MALFVSQDDNRTELQKRLAEELQGKARDRSKRLAERPDGVEDSQYIQGTKKTTSLAWAWILILFVFIGIIIWLTVITRAS